MHCASGSHALQRAVVDESETLDHLSISVHYIKLKI